MTYDRAAFAPWDVRDLPRILSADEAARRCRQFAEIERQLAALLEQWAPEVGNEELKGTFARHARQHSWHVTVFEDLLSDSTAPGDGTIDDLDVDAFLKALAEPPGGDLLGFLVGVYRVLLPRQISAYTYYLRALGTSAADSDARWLGIVLQDEFDGIRDGELAIQALLVSAADVERAANRRLALETHLVKAGGIVGPQSLGAQKEASVA